MQPFHQPRVLALRRWLWFATRQRCKHYYYIVLKIIKQQWCHLVGAVAPSSECSGST